MDELGTLEDAIAAAKVMAGMDKDAEVELLQLPKPRNFIDVLMESRSEARMPASGIRHLLGAFPEMSDHVQAGEALLRLKEEPVWTILPGRVQIR